MTELKSQLTALRQKGGATRSHIGRFALIAAAVLSLSAVTVAPARADDDRGEHRGWQEHDRGWHGHEWRDHEWYEHHPYVYSSPGYYYAPPAYYAPPPVVYAPQPVAPSLNFVIPLR